METEIGQGTSSCVKDAAHIRGSRLSADSFSDNARHNEDELIPDAGSHIGIAELFLQDGPHPRLRTTSPALWPNVSLMPLKSSMSMMPRKKAFLQPKPASAF